MSDTDRGSRVLKLVDDVVRSFRVAKLFDKHTDKVIYMDFSAQGDRLVTCTTDERIAVYDAAAGVQLDTVFSKKYGVDVVRFGHNNTEAIHNSTKVDDTVRYLSLHEKRYIQYFTGHTKKVVSLSVSPITPTFASGSLDKTIRIWDLRTPLCQNLMNVMGKPVVAFDPKGLVLAVGINSQILSIYDTRFINGSFLNVKLPQDEECDWSDLKFSPDGCSIIIPTNGSLINLFNAFNGAPIQKLTGHLNNARIPIEASFSPDSQYVFSGSTDGRIHIWNAITGRKICVLKGNHPSPVSCVKFNPKFMMMASACTNVAFWLPTIFHNGTNSS